MGYGIESFITIYDLLLLANGNNPDILIFGATKTSNSTISALKAFSLKYKYFVDNDINKHGTFFEGVEVIPPQKLLEMQNFVVLIGSSFYSDIMKSLFELEIRHVYVLADTICYSYREAILDNKAIIEKQISIEGVIEELSLTTAIRETSNNYNESNLISQSKVLIKLWDGLGDQIIKLGILEYLCAVDPGERFFFVTDNKSKYDFLNRILPNVLYIDRMMYKKDRKYRSEIIESIWCECFEYSLSYVLYPFKELELFDGFNTNIPHHYYCYRFFCWNNGISNCDDVLEGMSLMMRKLFGLPNNMNFDSKGRLSKYLVNEELPTELMSCSRYIVVALGSASWQNFYPPEKAAVIIDHFVELGYVIVLLGEQSAEKRLNSAIHALVNEKHVLNYTGELSVYGSLKVVEKANLFFGLDSALSHAAYSLDKKAVILMAGNVEVYKYRHNGDPNIVYLNKKLECNDCTICINSFYNNKRSRYGECISLTDPNEIIAAMELLLSQ